MIDGHHRNEGAYNAAKKIKEVMEVAEQMSEEVLQELEKSFCNTI